jgi:hypothetical protein
MGLMFSLRLISEVELKSVAEREPVEGLKVSLVEDTFAAEIEPDVALVNVKNLDAFVEVSSVIVVPEVTAVVVTPVINPLAFTVMLGIAPPEPKVPTLELTVANVVALLTEVISPVKFGILVVDVAVPVRAPTNVVAVMIPDALIPDALIVTPEPTTILVAVAAPNTGVTSVGLVANTATPEPVSSVSAVANCADVKEPNDVVVLTDVIAPVRFGILVVEVAVPVSVPTKVVAVTTPVTLTSPTT